MADDRIDAAMNAVLILELLFVEENESSEAAATHIHSRGGRGRKEL